MPLTYEWITPLLIGIIGWMIKNYLSSIDKNIENVKNDLMKHVNMVEEFIKETNERYNIADKRITRIEDHIEK